MPNDSATNAETPIPFYVLIRYKDWWLPKGMRPDIRRRLVLLGWNGVVIGEADASVTQRIEPAARKRGADVNDEISAVELMAGDVDRDPEIAPARAPRRHLPACSLEHPATDGHDLPGGLEQREDIAAILAVVKIRNLLPFRPIFDFLGGALEDYRFIGLFRSDHTMGLCGNVFRLARARTGAEPESVFPPDAPNKHEVRPAIRARRSDPVVVRFFEALKRPVPGLEARGWVSRSFERVRPKRTARNGLTHRDSPPLIFWRAEREEV